MTSGVSAEEAADAASLDAAAVTATSRDRENSISGAEAVRRVLSGTSVSR